VLALDRVAGFSSTPAMPLRAIVDTNVFLSALWSKRGAAFEIFAELRQRLADRIKKEQMTTIQAQVPDPLAKQLEELAEQEKVSVDQLVSIALAYQVSAWRKPRHSSSTRSARRLGEV